MYLDRVRYVLRINKTYNMLEEGMFERRRFAKKSAKTWSRTSNSKFRPNDPYTEAGSAGSKHLLVL
jgi:hypothetical protein